MYTLYKAVYIYIYIYILIDHWFSLTEDFFFVHRNWREPSDQPYDWGRHPWVHRWLMRPNCAWKSLGQWKQGMVAEEADVALPFLSFLCSSVATFLLVSQTFTPCLTTSRHLSLSCATYSRELGAIMKYYMETFWVSLKRFFWPLWERLLRDSLP